MSVLFPNTVANLLDGPVRAIWAPITEPIPDDISDMIDMESPYSLQGTWTDFGATTDTSSYTRDLTEDQYTIEQETSAVLSKVTETNRKFTLPVAEITPENMQMIEEGGQIGTIASGSGKGAQKKVGFGTIPSLTRYRIAFIAQRDPGFGGIVTESDSSTRGPFVAVVGYQASISADSSGLDIKKGALSARPINFQLYPDPTIGEARDNAGCFLFEDPGTIA